MWSMSPHFANWKGSIFVHSLQINMELYAFDTYENKWNVKTAYISQIILIAVSPSELTTLRLNSANCHSWILKLCIQPKYHLIII